MRLLCEIAMRRPYPFSGATTFPQKVSPTTLVDLSPRLLMASQVDRQKWTTFTTTPSLITEPERVRRGSVKVLMCVGEEGGSGGGCVSLSPVLSHPLFQTRKLAAIARPCVRTRGWT